MSDNVYEKTKKALLNNRFFYAFSSIIKVEKKSKYAFFYFFSFGI